MNCSKCKNNIPDDSIFCPICGVNLESYKKNQIPDNSLESIESQKKGVVKYCKKCGGEIIDSTKKCSKCGKQYFRIPISRKKLIVFGYIFTLMVILGLVFLNIYQYINYTKINDNNINKITSQSTNIDVLHDRLDGLYTEISNLQGKATFMNNHVVIVPDNGTRRYHKYGCEYLDTTNGFWVYNTEAAPSDGYRPCPYCIK